MVNPRQQLDGIANVVIGGVETPYQVVMITRQLLDHRVLPAAISYIATFTPDMATVVAQSVEVAAPGARRNIIDSWIIPQPEATRLTQHSFIEAGLADLNGPEIDGYGKLLGHGWLLQHFTPEELSASEPASPMASVKAVQANGDILVACRVTPTTQPSVEHVFTEHNARHIRTIET